MLRVQKLRYHRRMSIVSQLPSDDLFCILKGLKVTAAHVVSTTIIVPAAAATIVIILSVVILDVCQSSP